MEKNKESIPSKNERQPFVRLDNAGFLTTSSFLYEVPGHPDMVVRKSFVQTSFGEDENWKNKNAHISDEEEKRKKIVHEKAEYLREKAFEFKKIIGDLGIRMAKTDYVIGESPATGAPMIFGVTKKIEGENLEKIKELDAETVLKIDEIYAKVIGAFIDSYLKNGKAWYDLKNGQFVYGKTEEDKNPDIYLVDVDPIILDWNNHDFEKQYFASKKEVFWTRIHFFRDEIGDLERRMKGEGYYFTKTQEALQRAEREVRKL